MSPVWLDLGGGALPAVGRQREARACNHYAGLCCNMQVAVAVRNCGPFLLYRLTALGACPLRYCVQPGH